jgi:ketosteroid isomerase-like protein
VAGRFIRALAPPNVIPTPGLDAKAFKTASTTCWAHTPKERDMKSATELLEAYLDNVRTPKVSASQFAEDGVLELPWVKAYAQGPVAVEKLLAGMLAKIPDFRFKNLTYFIRTPDQVAAEYQVEARVVETGKIYQQTYVGVLLAESGRIKLLREALDTVAAAKAFSKD